MPEPIDAEEHRSGASPAISAGAIRTFSHRKFSARTQDWPRTRRRRMRITVQGPGITGTGIAPSMGTKDNGPRCATAVGARRSLARQRTSPRPVTARRSPKRGGPGPGSLAGVSPGAAEDARPGRQLSARAIRRATPASDRGCDDSWHKDRRHRKGRVGAAGHRRPFIARPADAGLSGNWFQIRQPRRRGGITHKAFSLWRFRANTVTGRRRSSPAESNDRR